MSWMQTATGRRVDFLNPDPKQIDLEDVARALGGACRYVGGTTKHYSVAEHSCRISGWLSNTGAPLEEVLAAHFHDAPEAYMGDIPFPLKQAMPESVRHWYKTVETRLAAAMEVAFELPPGLISAPSKIVRDLDAAIVVSERKQLLNIGGQVSFDGWFTPPGDSDNWSLARCWDRDIAAAVWLQRAHDHLMRWWAKK